MFYNKEIMNLATPLNHSFKTEQSKEENDFVKIKFGELIIGDKFKFANNYLVKTGEFCAENDRAYERNQFLFNKKDFVFVKENLKSVQVNKDTSYVSEQDNIVAKDVIVNCKIVIKPCCSNKPGYIKVIEENEIAFAIELNNFDMNESWHVPILLLGKKLNLAYYNHNIQLCFDSERIWETHFCHDWNTIDVFTILFDKISFL